MNNQIAMMNEAFRRQPIDLAAMERTQRNNKRTVIDMDRLDTARALELTRMISHDDENLGQIITPIPFSKIEHDTEATLNVVMQALGLYTFPTEELTDWLQGEIDDDPDYEPHTAIEICYGTGSLKSGNSFGVDTRWVRSHCRRFYHIGNDDIHFRDPIMKMPHQRLSFDWLVTRGDSSKARIYVWENKNF